MSKTLILLFIGFLSFQSIQGQDKYFTRTGSITFESSVPTFEEVKATNDKVSAVLTSEGSFACALNMVGFRFKIRLMEEHFNENYIESKKYPKATFKGKLTDFEFSKLTNKFQDFEIKGTLTMRKKAVATVATCSLKLEDGNIVLKTNLSVKPESFDIEIPSIVRKKIAEDVAISANFILSKN